MFSESRKIIAIGGVPATGKSTIMKAFLSQFDGCLTEIEAHPLVPAIEIQTTAVTVLGHYRAGEKFPGTDRMSMAVQPKAMEYVTKSTGNLLFEGDRLFTASFLEHCAEHGELEILIITSNPTIIEARHIDRDDTQSEQFKTGRETKIDNIRSNFMLMDYIKTFEHNTPQDTAKIVSYLNQQLIYNVRD